MKNYPKINIGVGGMVIRNNLEILLIKRKSSPFVWSIPSGYLEENEDIFSTISREVKEETNARIKNIGIIAKRQRITKTEGNNLWIIVLSKYLSGKIKPDKHEVIQAKFFSLKKALKEEVTPITKKIITNFLKNNFNTLYPQKNFNKKNYKFYI